MRTQMTTKLAQSTRSRNRQRDARRGHKRSFLFEPLEPRLLLTRNFLEVEPANDAFPGQAVEHFSPAEVGVVDSMTAGFGVGVAAIPDGDQDFYVARLSVDGDLNVNIRHLGGDPSNDGGGDDLQVRLLDGVGSTISTLALSDAGDLVSFGTLSGVAGDPTWFVVEGVTATDDAEYQVRLTNVDREDNFGNNNRRGNATDLGAVSTINPADLVGYTITDPDRDFYKITADMNGPLTVNVVMPDGSGAAVGSDGPTNLGVRIRDAGGTLIATSGGTLTDVDSVQFEAVNGAMYFIEVYSGSRGQVNRYDLEIIKEGGDLSGYKFEDLNSDGLWDPDEIPLQGWTINLDLDDDGSIDRTDVTDANGFYQFTGVPSGTHQITEDIQAGFGQTLPGPDDNFEYIVTVGPHELVWDHLDFGNSPRASIHGTKFEDIDGDGVRDLGEPALPGWTIYLFDDFGDLVDTQVTMVDDPGTPEDETGMYWFTDLDDGNYTVGEGTRPGWIETTPMAPMGPVLPGYDLFMTDPGTTFVDLTLFVGFPLQVQLVGVPFGPGGTDTIVERLAPANVDFVGQQDTIPIELVALHLESVQPVDLGGELFVLDVFAGRDFGIPQQPGQMTISRDHQFGGSFQAVLPVQAQILATSLDNPTSLPIEIFFEDLFLSESVWSAEPGPGDPRLVDPNLAGMRPSGNFYPGIDHPNACHGEKVLTLEQAELAAHGVLPAMLEESIAPGVHQVGVSVGETLVGVDFGNTVKGSIHGYKYEDLNANGIDDDEPRLEGVRIELTGIDGKGNFVQAFETTDANGEYWFTELLPGTYTVSETPPPGTVPTTPASYNVSVFSREELVALPGQAMLPPSDPRHEVVVGPTLAFGNTFKGSIHGFKFEDLDADGIYEPANGDVPWEGIEFELVGTDGAGNPVGPIDMVTDANGEFAFTDLVPGHYWVREEVENLPSLIMPSTPLDFHVTVESRQEYVWADGAAGLPQDDPRVEINVGTELMFGNFVKGSIHGYKFEDLNVNGVDDGEPRLPGVRIELEGDFDGNGTVETRLEITDENGEYWFLGLRPGDYTVSEQPPFGSFPSTPPAGLAPPVIAGASWQNPSDPLDVNGDGFFSTPDGLILENELLTTGDRLLTEPPVPGDQPPPFFDVSGDGFLSQLDLDIVEQALNPSAVSRNVTILSRQEVVALPGQARLDGSMPLGDFGPTDAGDPGSLVTLKTFSADGLTEISTIGINEPFVLKAFVADVSGVYNGVFSHWVDVNYDSMLASVDGPFTHDTTVYGQFQGGDASTPGEIDAAGSFANGFFGPGPGEFFLWSLPMMATSPGTLTFVGSTTTDPTDPGDAGQTPQLDVGLFGLSEPVCPSASTIAPCDLSQAYVDATLTIEDNGNSDDPRVEVVIGPHLAFGNAFEGSIHGFKFEDVNADGIRQPGEPPLEGVEIVLDWIDPQGNPRTRSTFTDDNGEYWFTWLRPGITYNVTEHVGEELVLNVPAGGAEDIFDGDFFTLSVGLSTAVFEFDLDGLVQPGNVAIPFAPLSTQNAIADTIVQEIPNSGLLLTPENLGSGTVLIGPIPGVSGDATGAANVSLDVIGLPMIQTTPNPPPLTPLSGQEFVANPEQGRAVQRSVSFPWWWEITIDPVSTPTGVTETLMLEGLATIGFSEAINIQSPTAPPFPLVDAQGNSLPLPDGQWIINTEIMELNLAGVDSQGNQVVLGLADGVPQFGQVFASANPGDDFLVGDSFFDVFFEIDITDQSGGTMTIAPDPNDGPVVVSMNFTDDNQPPVPQQIPRPDVRWMPTFFWADGFGRELLDDAGQLWDELISIHAVPHAEVEKPVRPIVEPTLEFGNTFRGSIHGYKFEDLNVDGDDDAEPRLPGVTITLTGDVDGDRATDTRSMVTDVNGEYWFEDLYPGDYTVTETPPFGTFPTTPTSFDVTVLSRQELVALPGQAHLEPGDPEREVVIGPVLAFGNAFEGSIHGFKYEDLNGDGDRDPGEPPLSQVPITISWVDSSGGNRARTTFTDDNGEYWFQWLEPGIVYTTTELAPPGSMQTSPNPPPIRIGSGEEWVATPEQGAAVQRLISFPWWMEIELDPVPLGGQTEVLMVMGRADFAFSDLVDTQTGDVVPLVDPTNGLPLPVPQGREFAIQTELVSMSLTGTDPVTGNPVTVTGSGVGVGVIQNVGGFLTGGFDENVNPNSFFDIEYEIQIDTGFAGFMTIAPETPARVGMSFTPADEIAATDVRWMPTFLWRTGLAQDLFDDAGELWDQVITIHAIPHVEVEKPVRPVVEPTLAFGNTYPGSIHGFKFNDLDADGVYEPNDGDVPFQNVPFELTGIDGLGNPVGPVIVPTNASGEFWFTGFKPGQYRVREVVEQLPGNVSPTTPTEYNVTIASREEYVWRDGAAMLPQGAPQFEVNVGSDLMFGNSIGSSIHGLKFDDLNGDGARDAGEPGIAGWTITLTDIGGGGSQTTLTMADDPGTPNIDETGMYWFNNLDPGTYEVSEENRTGWTQTAPGAPGTYSVTLASGDLVEDRDFGNFKNIDIRGTKFRDDNFNGQRDPNEPALQGFTIFLDNNNNGQPDDGPGTTTVTAADGTYSFLNLGPGIYRMREVQQPGFIQTAPVPNLDIAARSGQNMVVDFGNAPQPALSGIKFNDLNANGQQEVGESPLAGFTFELYLDVDNDGNFEPDGPFGRPGDDGAPIVTSVSNALGIYRLGSLALPTGRYFIREVTKQGWVQTFPVAPDYYTIDYVTGTSISGLDFGNHSCGDVFNVGNGVQTVTSVRNGILSIELLGGGAFTATRVDGLDFSYYDGNSVLANSTSAASRASEFDGANQRIDILINAETPPGTQFNLTVSGSGGDSTLRVLNAVNVDVAGTLALIIVGDVCGDFIAVRDDPANGANSDAKRIFVGAVEGEINGGADLGFRGIEYNRDIIDGIFGTPTISRVEIDGRGGDDIIRVGDDITQQQSLINGGDGDDIIRLGAQKGTVQGGAGIDFLVGGRADDIFNGGSGNDLIFGAAGADRAFGGDGDDLIGGGDDNDALLRGGNGNDQISGGRGRDRLLGDGGFDIAYAGVDGLADLLVSAEVRNVSPDTVEPLLETLVDAIFNDGLADANDTIDELIDNILLP